MTALQAGFNIEEELAAITTYSAVISEWLMDSGMQERVSSIDVLLWWSRAPEAIA